MTARLISVVALLSVVPSCVIPLEKLKTNLPPERYPSQGQRAELRCLAHYAALVSTNVADVRRKRTYVNMVPTIVTAVVATALAIDAVVRDPTKPSETEVVGSAITGGLSVLGGLTQLIQSFFEKDQSKLLRALDVLNGQVDAMTSAAETSGGVAYPQNVANARQNVIDILNEQYGGEFSDNVLRLCSKTVSSQ